MIEKLVNDQIHDNLNRYQSQLLTEGTLNTTQKQSSSNSSGANNAIPECFPKNTTKKYVEVSTGEILYVKDNGEVFF